MPRHHQPLMTDDRCQLHLGDCIDVLCTMPDASIDAVVTDPPYALPGGFMGKRWDNHDGREDTGFGYWFAGFTDGEGCFRVQRHERGTHVCTFQIKLRRDDRSVLERIRRYVGHGTIRDVAGSKNSNDQAAYVVQDQEGCEALVGLFRRFPLTAKKAMDFEVWADAVGEWVNRPRGNRWHGAADQAQAAALKTRLENVRSYVEIPWSGHRFQDWCRLWAAECLRVLKPGGYLLAFGATRQYHRLACGIEDAGFEIRDCISWVYGSGFPKSLDVSKAIDKAAGKTGNRGPMKRGGERLARLKDGRRDGESRWGDESGRDPYTYLPATPAAQQWSGWGTALKPAHEPIVMARKPFNGTVAKNVLKHGTGAINVDGCRVSAAAGDEPLKWENGRGMGFHGAEDRGPCAAGTSPGRWPANLIHDGSDEVVALFPQTGISRGGNSTQINVGTGRYGWNTGEKKDIPDGVDPGYGDSVSAARFFYTAKASSSERQGVQHPTVKPLDLMAYLCRLVTPPNGIVLDPFMGSGTTIKAALAEGFRGIGIERDPSYYEMAQHRLSGAQIGLPLA